LPQGGQYGIAIAKVNPRAEILAQRLAGAHGRGGKRERRQWPQISEIPGDAFKVDWRGRSGPDHEFPASLQSRRLREILRRFIAHCGRAVGRDSRFFVPDENRVLPPEAAFQHTMLVSTPSGDAYTFAQLDQMFNAAGFSRSELRDLEPTSQRVVLSYSSCWLHDRV